ncbi:MAG: hypothetical protein ACLPVF_15785 [Acidimicrobiales bacterium]
MRGLVRLSAVGTLVVAVVAVMTSSAGAVTPGTYTVSATGSVLTFTALGALNISGAASSATAGSGQPTTATGSGLTSPLGNSTSSASEGTAGASDTPAEACGPLPALSVVIASASAACGQATAAEDAQGDPTASATGSLPQVTIGTGLSSITAPISSTVSSTVTTLLAPVQTALNSVSSSAGAALPTSTGISLSTLISDLEGISLSDVASLVNVNLGTSTSGITTSTAPNGDTIETATASTQGISIELLPGLLGGSPLATITVGNNSATTAIDRATGAVTASDDPSDVSVTIAGQTINIGEGTGPTPILAGTPLASTIEVGGGSATPGQGSGSAQAGDLELDLLTGINGGIGLNLVTSQTSASGAPAAAAAAPPAPGANQVAQVAAAAPAAVPNVTSVHTGEFWAGTLPVFLLAGMALSGLVLIARRRIVAVARSLSTLARHSTLRSAGGPPPGPASGTSSVPPPVSGPARRQPR